MRCGIPVLFAASPSRIAPNRNHGVSLMKPEKALSKPGVDLRSPAPSPNGDYLAYLVVAGNSASVEVVDAKSQNSLAKFEKVNPNSRICWSPDSEKIGYFGADGKVTLAHVLQKVSVSLPASISGMSFAWLHD